MQLTQNDAIPTLLATSTTTTVKNSNEGVEKLLRVVSLH
jgi:hypothetical protein